MADKIITNAAQKMEILYLSQIFLMQVMLNNLPPANTVYALRLVARMLERGLSALEKCKTPIEQKEALQKIIESIRTDFDQELEFIMADHVDE